MSTSLWIMFYFFFILSIVPVFKLEQVRTNPKYRVLWYLSISVFSWSLVMAFQLVSSDTYFIYFISMMTYPIIATISYFLYETFQTYIHKKTNIYFKSFLIGFIIIDFIISMTNPLHQWMLKIPLNDLVNQTTFMVADRGIFFYIHTLICYTILMIGFIRILIFLAKNKNQGSQTFPFQLMLFSVSFGIIINFLHLFVYEFNIDPTYIFLVVMSYTLYSIIYRRDYHVNLILSSKKYIMDHMREMYIVVDKNDEIVEYSKNLKERFHIHLVEGTSLEKLIKELEKKAIIFTKTPNINHRAYEPTMHYLHMTKQSFKIGALKSKGYLISLFDESADIKLMTEIDELRTHDLMTGLYNRNYFEESRKTYDEKYLKLGIILLDMDGLKLHNDYLGHKAGDVLLTRFAANIMEAIKPYPDSIAIRLGGDEFGIVIKEANNDILNDIMKHLSISCDHKDVLKKIGFSFGVAMRKGLQDTTSNMLKRCDVALYELKATHKDFKNDVEQALKKQLENLHKERENK